ncbi:kinase-like domain-containing protein [Sporodiniella umbellata]|nr:kinase-like domain-containing protein [Sporodiniella umbellata]
MFLSRFAVDELDDPLSIYEQKILKQVKEDDISSAYATLEKVVYVYRYDLRYQNSPRYLKLWLIFAFHQQNPMHLLQWLAKNHIGDRLATLYEAIAYENLKLDKVHDAEMALSLGIENNAIPLKRLKREHLQLKLNRFISFEEHKYTLAHYNTTLETSKEYYNKILDNDGLLLYTCPEYLPENINKLSWLNLQLEHNARASILREVYYQKEEASLEELRVKYSLKGRAIRGFKKWTWKEPVQSPGRIAKQEKASFKKSPDYLKDMLLSRQQTKYETKRSITLTKENKSKKLISGKNQIKKTEENKSKNDFSQPPLKLIPVLTKHHSSPSKLKPLTKTLSAKGEAVLVKENLENENIQKEKKDQNQTTKNAREQKESVDEIPHSPDFVQSQINASGARCCTNYHIIKNSAASLEKMLSSWFAFDKKKNIWRQTIKKEKGGIIQLLDKTFSVLEKLGEGGMAQVYLVQDPKRLEFFGLKVQKPPNPWEFYIHYQINQRQNQNKSAFRLLPIFAYYYFVDTSYMLIPYIRHGTLLDIYNKYIKARKVMPEPVVVLFMHQIIQQVNLLHSLDIVHNDLKLDNVMLTSNDMNVFPSVILIDFGHSIDKRVLKTSKCKAKWPPPCSRSQYPLFNVGYIPIHADYWEVASMSHILLYGEPMEVTTTYEGKYIVKQKIKRYWHVELWSLLFDFLLNQPKKQTVMTKLLQEFDKLVVPDKFAHECIQLLYRQ